MNDECIEHVSYQCTGCICKSCKFPAKSEMQMDLQQFFIALQLANVLK